MIADESGPVIRNPSGIETPVDNDLLTSDGLVFEKTQLADLQNSVAEQ